MKTRNYFIIMGLICISLQIKAQNPVVASAQKKPVILKGGTIHTGTGEVIENGLIAFSGGKITWVGKASESKIDSTGYEVIDVSGKQVYPGLIFPNTTLGLTEIGSGLDVANDTRETGDLNPDVRAITAYNTDSQVIPVIRSNGILLAQIVPQGTLLPGTTSIVQLDAWSWKDAAYRADNGMMMGWPRKKMPAGRRGGMPLPPGSGADTYTKSVELLEKIFTDAVAYAAIGKPVNFNLRLDAMKGLFDGSKTLFVSAPEAKGIIEAILFAKRYGVKKIVLTEADETAWIVRNFLKENNIPVLLDNPFTLPKYDYSDIKEPFKLAAMFEKEGIMTGLTYSNHAYGNLPFTAGESAAYGLTREEALQTVTLNTAKILGIDDITGSLEAGKDANIVVSTGDLLDMRTNNVELAFITGRSISLDNKHKQLYRRFEAKYDNYK
jgi:imidazolonepropionase-like amidohydrolase